MSNTICDLPVDDRLVTEEVANLLRMHPGSLIRNARRGIYSPAPVKLGGKYLWPRSLVRSLLGLDGAAPTGRAS